MAWRVEFLDMGVKAALEGRDGIARAAYVAANGKRVVVVHVFEKKTQKTPRREIEIALKRAKEVK